MSVTLREQRRLLILLAVWVLVSVLAAVTGPFHTGQVLGLLARATYWAAIVGLSILGSELTLKFVSERAGFVEWGAWGSYVVLLTSAVQVINRIVFGILPTPIAFVSMIAVIGTIVGVVHAGMALVAYAHPPQVAPKEEAVDPATRFLRRLPLGDRGPLIRIEAQDHYLNVVTQNGSALILLRLGEAISELEDVSGLQVHRSHWVALDAVEQHQREKGRDILILRDGARVPVSRSNKRAAKEAGLF